MPCVVFEPTIPASERAKTVHTLDRPDTGTGVMLFNYFKLKRDTTKTDVLERSSLSNSSVIYDLWNLTDILNVFGHPVA
jgi:hypothetical protein